MKRFRFSLEKVLAVRTTRERLARVQLAEAARKVREEEERLKVYQEHYRRGRELFLEWGRQGRPALAVLLLSQHLEQAWQRLREQEARLATAQAEWETARRLYVQRRQEKRMLERLKEKRFRVYLREVEAAEQKWLDELGVTRARGEA